MGRLPVRRHQPECLQDGRAARWRREDQPKCGKPNLVTADESGPKDLATLAREFLLGPDLPEGQLGVIG